MNNPEGNEELPSISVVISTRNRGNSIVATVRSILDCDYPNFDLKIIDQSDDNLTEIALQPFLPDSRIYYFHSDTKGLSNGRNLGASVCKSELIAFTDDDCIVPVNWLCEMVRAFSVDPRVGIVWGNVSPVQYDTSAGFIPAYEMTEPFLIRNIRDKNKCRGMGACMGIRRGVWKALNGFDRMLGAGAYFGSCEEWDIGMKALFSGYYLYQTPRVSVLHFGFRTWKQGRSLSYRNWRGIGAISAKHFKLGKWAALNILTFELFRVTLPDLFKNIVLHRRVRGLTPVYALLRGFLAGLLVRVDPVTGNYSGRKFEQEKKPEAVNHDAVLSRSTGPS